MPNSFQPRLSSQEVNRRLESVKNYDSDVATLQAQIKSLNTKLKNLGNFAYFQSTYSGQWVTLTDVDDVKQFTINDVAKKKNSSGQPFFSIGNVSAVIVSGDPDVYCTYSVQGDTTTPNFTLTVNVYNPKHVSKQVFISCTVLQKYEVYSQ